MEKFDFQHKSEPKKPEELKIKNSIQELNESTEEEIKSVIEKETENPMAKEILKIFEAYRKKIGEIAHDMAKIFK